MSEYEKTSSGSFSDIIAKAAKSVIKFGTLVVGLISTAAARLLMGKKEFEREMEEKEMKMSRSMAKDAIKEHKKNSEKEEKVKNKEEKSHNREQEDISEDIPEEKKKKDKETGKEDVKADKKKERKSALTPESKDEMTYFLCKTFKSNDCFIKETKSSIIATINGENPEAKIEVELDKKGNIVQGNTTHEDAVLVASAYVTTSLNHNTVPSIEDVRKDLDAIIDNGFSGSFSYNNIEFTIAPKDDNTVTIDIEFIKCNGQIGSMDEPWEIDKREIAEGSFENEIHFTIGEITKDIRTEFYTDYLKEEITQEVEPHVVETDQTIDLEYYEDQSDIGYDAETTEYDYETTDDSQYFMGPVDLFDEHRNINPPETPDKAMYDEHSEFDPTDERDLTDYNPDLDR